MDNEQWFDEEGNPVDSYWESAEVVRGQRLANAIREMKALMSAFPPAAWDEIIGGCGAQVQDTIEGHADGLAVYFARMSAYTSARMLDQGHSTAVRKQNATANKVRKALGYSYPKADISF